MSKMTELEAGCWLIVLRRSLRCAIQLCEAPLNLRVVLQRLQGRGFAWTRLAMSAPPPRQQAGVWYCGSAALRLIDIPNYLQHENGSLVWQKSKKSIKPPQRHVSLGTPTNIAVGPLGFRAELDVDPKGERGFSILSRSRSRSNQFNCGASR